MDISLVEKQLQLPSPVQRLRDLEVNDYQVFMKRDDLIHPYISGNKWRKLKYNLNDLSGGDYDQVVTLGGPFSNHLVAVAAACYYLRVKCIGLVRGDELDPENPSLNRCQEYGMEIRMISRSKYAQRNEKGWIKNLYPNEKALFLEEGGSSGKFSKGVEEVIAELSFKPDFVVLPIGTAGTLMGLINSSKDRFKVIGISPFKEGKVTIPCLDQITTPHEIVYDYAMKGYGRYDSSLVSYINDFWRDYGIPLDPIYNGKGMMALNSMIRHNKFPPSSKILYLNTGGLQGIAGFNYVNKSKEKIDIPSSIYFPAIDL